ncbi:MAG: DUF4388 domain-containing protein [Deltaproteobacteria bacterium]|nr:DUF4388 domain-containing protein [Deltaproteobacteria bacterium]
MAKIVSMQKKDSNFVSGLPLTAFLQMLEQEQQTCSLFVSAEDKSGILFIKEGELIDAVADDVIGIEAANIILSWKDATIEMTDAEERTRKIHTPLTHIILQAAVKQDEALSGTPQQITEPKTQSPKSKVSRLIEKFQSIAGIRQYYLLNLQGEMIIQSGQNWKMGDFIAYCILTGSQIRKNLNAKGPSRILLSLKTGQNLLIFSGAGMIIGLLLNQNVSADNILEQLKPALGAE